MWPVGTQAVLGAQRRRCGTEMGPEVGLGKEGRPLAVRAKGLIPEGGL